MAAYASFARGATPFTGPDEHLSTLFPPVRPRGRYLEVRFLDVQPEQRLAEVVGRSSPLMYDDDVRGRVLAELEPEAPRLAELVARGAPTASSSFRNEQWREGALRHRPAGRAERTSTRRSG